jgi:AAA domain
VSCQGRLSVLAGAPGAGKTAVLPVLRERLGGMVVVDMDAFLDAGSELARADLRYTAEFWPAYTALCRQLVGTVLESGVDCLLMTPLEPREAVAWPAGQWAVLDCADAARRDRLARRGMTGPQIEDAVADAARLRTLGLPVLGSDGTVAETAGTIARWAARNRTPGPSDA